MSEKKSISSQLLFPMIILMLGWASSSFVIVDAREIAVITMFGDPVQPLKEPGFRLKIPWPIQEVERFDARAQLLELEALEGN